MTPTWDPSLSSEGGRGAPVGAVGLPWKVFKQRIILKQSINIQKQKNKKLTFQWRHPKIHETSNSL